MSENKAENELKIRLDFGDHAPDLIFALNQGESGVVVERVLDGCKHLDALLREVDTIIEGALPAEQLPAEVKERLINEFRLGFYYLLFNINNSLTL